MIRNTYLKSLCFNLIILTVFITLGYWIVALFLKSIDSVTAQNESSPIVEDIYVKGKLNMIGSTSGTVKVGTAAAAGNWTLLLPTTAGNNTQFLQTDGTGATTWASASGSSYRTLVTLSADATANSTTFEAVGDLTVAVTSGTTYRFYALIAYTSSAAAGGSRWALNGPSTSLLSYATRNTSTATAEAINFQVAYTAGTVSASSVAAGNIAVIEGIITPSATGTLTVMHASEASGTTITALAGSTLEWW